MSITATATVRTTRDITLRPSQLRRLRTELRAMAEVDAQIAALEARRTKAKDAIEAVRAETGEDTLSVEGYTITRVPGAVRRVLDEKKLIALYDLSTDDLDACRVEKVSAAYTKVTAPKEEK